MKILVRFNHNIATPKQVKSFKVFDLGETNTTINDLLDITTIEVDDQTLPVLKISHNDSLNYYLINNVGMTPGLIYPYYTDDFMKEISMDDLIPINGGYDDFILSSQPTSLANRKGDSLYGIIDQYTGEDITLDLINFVPDVVDNIIYFQVGNEYFKRNYDYAKPEWFNLDLSHGDIAINKAIIASNRVVFEKDKIYNISNPIKLTKNKILEGNFCVIQSISPTNIFQGIDELLSNVYQHNRAVIRDFILKTSVTPIGINLKGFKYTTVSNNRIEFLNTNASTKGIYLKHGALNYEQCYFNQVENNDIYLASGGIGISIEGTIGTSGANCNTVTGGSISGYDTYGVMIKDNSVGNLIQMVDAEAFDQSLTEQIGFYTVNSTQNTFIACHCETYKTAIKFDTNSYANKVISFTHAANNLVSEDLGENVFEFVNSDGVYASSIGKSNEDLSAGVHRISTYTHSAFRLDTNNPFANSRNIAIINGVGGFKFNRSNAKDGDPLFAGTTFLELNDAGQFVFLNYPRITNILEYANNAAALGDGLTAGALYRDSTGNLKIVY